MQPTVYLNGDFLPVQDARLHVSDLSILRGYGIFDYFRYVDRRPRFLDDHLQRFIRSAERMGLAWRQVGGFSQDGSELAQVVRELIDRNPIDDGGIRLVLTGGYSEDGYTPTVPNLVGAAYAFTPPDPRKFETGCAVVLHRYERQFPEVKSIDYLEGIRIQPMLKREGADYALYVDRDELVRESDRSNFMLVTGGTLVTPVENVLLGVTRKHLLRLAQTLGIPTEERSVSVEELGRADELIICSSTKGPMPITRLDGEPVADGKPGPLSRKLMEAWKEI